MGNRNSTLSSDSSSTQTSTSTPSSTSSSTPNPQTESTKTTVISFDDMPKPKSKPKKWETSQEPRISALKYNMECYASMGDFIHGASFTVEEIFVPELNIVLNVGNSGMSDDPQLTTFECDEPRIMSTSATKDQEKLHSKLSRLESIMTMQTDKNFGRIVPSMYPEEYNDGFTVHHRSKELSSDEIKSLETQIRELKDQLKSTPTKDQLFEKMIQDGKLQKVSIPSGMAHKALQLCRLQKEIDALKADWMTKYN